MGSNMENSSAVKYVGFNLTALFSAAVVLLAFSLPNILILLSPHIHGSIAHRAAAWQAREHGIVALPVRSEAEFKHLRLAQKSSDLEILVLGSSRIMGLDSEALGLRSYNLSISSNNVAVAIAQAQSALEISASIHTVYFSLDWAIGDVFYPFPIPPLIFTKSDTLILDEILRLMRESISTRRLRMLIDLFWDDPIALKDLLMTGVLSSRQCPDGSRIADFLFTFSVKCFGFRDDGSATFDFRPSVSPQQARAAIAGSVSDASQYVRALASTSGRPNQLYLSEIARLSRDLRSRRGGVVVIIPPLLPGIEQAMLERADSREHLRTYKEEIGIWAEREHIQLMDLGASEKIGCTAADFMDAHHVNRSCWIKAFTGGYASQKN